jgi:hypothetical protein
VSRTKGNAFGSDDDEVELTYDVGRGGTGDGSIWKNQGSSAAEQGIVVQTQVSVTHQDRRGRTSTE